MKITVPRQHIDIIPFTAISNAKALITQLIVLVGACNTKTYYTALLPQQRHLCERLLFILWGVSPPPFLKKA